MVVRIVVVQDVVTLVAATPRNIRRDPMPKEQALAQLIAPLEALRQVTDTAQAVQRQLAPMVMLQDRLQRKTSRQDRPAETKIALRSQVLDQPVPALRVAALERDAL